MRPGVSVIGDSIRALLIFATATSVSSPMTSRSSANSRIPSQRNEAFNRTLASADSAVTHRPRCGCPARCRRAQQRCRVQRRSSHVSRAGAGLGSGRIGEARGSPRRSSARPPEQPPASRRPPTPSGQSGQRRTFAQHGPSGLRAVAGAASTPSAAASSPPRKRPPRRRQGRPRPERGMSPFAPQGPQCPMEQSRLNDTLGLTLKRVWRPTAQPGDVSRSGR